MVNNFSFSQSPNIIFGAGEFKNLHKQIKSFGNKALIITGSSSFKNSIHYKELLKSLNEESIESYFIAINNEPSPELVDKSTNDFKDKNIDVVISIGGGSVIDAGKAISAMLNEGTSVMDFLEGVGKGKKHSGNKVPFIAIPTTSGTGSEATKNAVLSNVGTDGFKKSLRHDNFIPNIALLDPELTLSCPASVSASCGMDAFTQLLESYTSSKSSLITDSLSFSGLEKIKTCLIPSCTDKANDINTRAGMAYGSLISGITLANAGLGIVHGFASSIGGYFDIPHGVVCGTLLGAATRVNIEKMKLEPKKYEEGLKKYADIGKLFSSKGHKDQEFYLNYLIDTIEGFVKELNLPSLSKFGINKDHFEKIIEKTGNKNNPIELTKDNMKKILSLRLQ